MYAIIKTGGKQYKVAVGDMLKVEKLNVVAGETFIFEEVLSVVDGEEMRVGQPFLAGAKVTAKVTEHGKGEKIRIFKYKAKSNYRKRQGHRQPYTEVSIEAIEG